MAVSAAPKRVGIGAWRQPARRVGTCPLGRWQGDAVTPGTWRGFRTRGRCVTRAPSRLCRLCPLGAGFRTPLHPCRHSVAPVSGLVICAEDHDQRRRCVRGCGYPGLTHGRERAGSPRQWRFPPDKVAATSQLQAVTGDHSGAGMPGRASLLADAPVTSGPVGASLTRALPRFGVPRLPPVVRMHPVVAGGRAERHRWRSVCRRTRHGGA